MLTCHGCKSSADWKRGCSQTDWFDGIGYLNRIFQNDQGDVVGQSGLVKLIVMANRFDRVIPLISADVTMTVLA